MMKIRRGPVAEDWRARILHARQSYEVRRGTIGVRTPMAQVFRRMIQTVIQPAFAEVGDFAKSQDVVCTIECELGGVQPRAMFCIRPSGRSIRYELDADGGAVREVEGVYHRPMGQRPRLDLCGRPAAPTDAGLRPSGSRGDCGEPLSVDLSERLRG